MQLDAGHKANFSYNHDSYIRWPLETAGAGLLLCARSTKEIHIIVIGILDMNPHRQTQSHNCY